MNIGDIVNGLAAGVGIDLSPDGKIAYYVEWSIGELCRVEVDTGKVELIQNGYKYPEDVEVDWDTKEIFVSERTGGITKVTFDNKPKIIANPGGAPHQLALVKTSGKRYLYTVCFDSGFLVRIDVDTGASTNIIGGLGHPIGLVIDKQIKYAYVTEQDKKSLTKIDLTTGATSVLHKELINPFFLAWDKDHTGIFCVQRDPSNSLIKIRLGTPVTSDLVASGLASRPSGVAPNSDNKKIYICADQKLQLISFNGVPSIKPDTPTLEIHKIQFNYDGSSAIALKDHVSDNFLHDQPEWIKNTRNQPAAYIRGTHPHIKVVFRKLAGFIPGKYAIGATGNLGGIKRKTVTLTFASTGLSNPVDFQLLWPLPRHIGKHHVTFNWNARNTSSASIPVSLNSTNHIICTTWKQMDSTKDSTLSNWVYKEPMLWTSEWAAGKNNEKEICDTIISSLHLSGLKYGIFQQWSVRDILLSGGGMCGGWYKMFQHLAHCQGVFVHRRFYMVDVRYLVNNEKKWSAIVIKSGGLNQTQPTQNAADYYDVNLNYPITASTSVIHVNEKRYCFYGPTDGHCINFLEYGGKLYLYDASFGTGPFEINSPLPPNDGTILGGMQLHSFKKVYLNTAVDYMKGNLLDNTGQLKGLTIKTSIIPDLIGGFEEITFKWVGS